MEYKDGKSFKKCDIFTPENITKKMSSFLKESGSLLEPSVGTGNLLQFIDKEKYDIDVFEMKKEYLDKIKDKTITKYNKDFLMYDFLDKKYDNIILNPPYVRIQDLDEEYVSFIKENWGYMFNGSFDLFHCFLYKCLKLLEENGVMVSITPSSYVFSKCCKNFRKYLVENRMVSKIIDFKFEKVFPGTSVYTCITVFKKVENSFVYNDKIIQYKDVNTDDYCFVKKKISGKVLGDIVNIRNGIATLCNKVFIHDTKLYDESCWEKIKTTKGIKWIIYPYKDGKIINLEYFSKENPKTFKFLKDNKELLDKRDKGKKKYEEFYAYGRKQGVKKSKNDKVIFLNSFLDLQKLNIKVSENMLFTGCIVIELKSKTNKTYKDVAKIIEKNVDYLELISTKRGGGWVGIKTVDLLNLNIF